MDDGEREALLARIAELESGRVDALKDGRRRKAEAGGYAYGAPPYGYRSVAGELVPDPRQQGALALMRSLRSKGFSFAHIAKSLSVHHHPPPRPGGRWHPKTVARICQREGIE